MKHLKLIITSLMLALMTVLSLTLASCASDDEPDNSDETKNEVTIPKNYNEYKVYYDALMNTSWKLISSKGYYYQDGNLKVTDNMQLSASYAGDSYLLNTILTFTSVLNENGSLKLKYSTLGGMGRWWIDNDELWYCTSYDFDGNPAGISAQTMGSVIRIIGSSGRIKELTDNRLYLIQEYSDGDHVDRIFSRISGYNPDDNGGNNSGGSNHHYPCKSCDESGKCWNCNGTGTDPITKKSCNTCHGNGKCPICLGRGYTII